MFGVVMPVLMLVAVAAAVLCLERRRQLRWVLYLTALALLPVAAYAYPDWRPRPCPDEAADCDLDGLDAIGLAITATLATVVAIIISELVLRQRNDAKRPY